MPLSINISVKIFVAINLFMDETRVPREKFLVMVAIFDGGQGCWIQI
jgi:hypothetical protein